MELLNVLIVLIILIILGVVYYSINTTNTAVVQKELANVETFQINNATPVPDGVLEEIIGSNVTYPSAKNPFMNVLVDEIKYNPTRAPAASVLDPSVNITLDDFFRTQFVDDPTDVFGKTQSQRQFYTTPSTSVPNDQESYQNWLYKIPGKTCKEGGFNCNGGSEGATIPWLNLGN